MSNKIALESEAKEIGNSTTEIITNKCCTKSRATELNCEVAGTYSDNQLVIIDDLSSARSLNSITIEIQGDSSDDKELHYKASEVTFKVYATYSSAPKTVYITDSSDLSVDFQYSVSSSYTYGDPCLRSSIELTKSDGIFTLSKGVGVYDSLKLNATFEGKSTNPSIGFDDGRTEAQDPVYYAGTYKIDGNVTSSKTTNNNIDYYTVSNWGGAKIVRNDSIDSTIKCKCRKTFKASPTNTSEFQTVNSTDAPLEMSSNGTYNISFVGGSTNAVNVPSPSSTSESITVVDPVYSPKVYSRYDNSHIYYYKPVFIYSTN